MVSTAKIATSTPQQWEPTAEDRARLRALPKYNAHCHLSGEFPIDTLKKYANTQQIQQIETIIREFASCRNYEKAFEIFPLISLIINTLAKVKDATVQACRRFQEDHNRFVLMRTGLKAMEGRGLEDYLNAVLEGIEESACEGFHVFLMLSLKRSSTAEMARATIDLALKHQSRGIVGIDISDISTIGDIRQIADELLRAKRHGLMLAVHMGEKMEENDQMYIVEHLAPDLVDHGVNLCEGAEAWAKERQVSVTVCLTSSIATNMHPPDQLHRWILNHLAGEHHPIDLGTDDSTIFGNITLSDELMRLSQHIGVEKAIEIATQSFERMNHYVNNHRLNDKSKGALCVSQSN